MTTSAARSTEAVKIILEEWINPTRPLAHLLMILDTLEWPTQRHPALNPHMEVLHPRALLPLLVVFFGALDIVPSPELAHDSGGGGGAPAHSNAPSPDHALGPQGDRPRTPCLARPFRGTPAARPP